jgi:CheY-like chemotaxis protein
MKIIYIDDDAPSRMLVRDMLAMRGLSLVEAADARTGLRLIAEGDFDLVMMDLRMPDINGLTAIRQLRTSGGRGASIPIIVVTADLSPGVKELCRGAGAAAFLEKPIFLDKLFQAIAAVGRPPNARRA